MKLDLIKYSINNLGKRKKRSFLTILSIFLGIMAVFALASFGQGISYYIDSLAQEQGADKIIIQPKSSFGPTAISDNSKFEENDIDFIRRINGVQEATGIIFESTKIQEDLDEKSVYKYVLSLPDDPVEYRLVLETGTIHVEEGRDLKKGDKNKILVGADYTVPKRVFEKPLGVGDKIYVNEEKFEIIGVFNAVGNPSDDQQVYVSEYAMTEILGFEKSYAFLEARAVPTVEPNALAEKITQEFRKHLGQEEGKEEFSAQTFEDLIASFSMIIDGMNMTLLVIVGISLLVAFFNILNTMFTAVLERTNEIGVMKAIGAQNKEILFIFVFESAFLGFLGGLVGVVLGFGIAELGGAIAANAGYSSLFPIYPWWLVLGALGFGTLVGALSGLAPAYQASRQSPVEALRYE